MQQITERRLKEIGNDVMDFVAVLERGTSIETLRDPLFFVPVMRRLKAGFMIRVLWDDHSAVGHLYVRAITDGLVHTEECLGGFTVFDALAREATGDIDIEGGISVEHAGLSEQWRIVRQADGFVIRTNLPSKGEARRHRSNYLKTLGQSAAA